VGAERQRVAGMLYKEALQTHTIEEQSKQLAELNAELARLQQARKENAEAVAAQKEMQEQLQALADSRSEHMQSILSLDESLANEQALREEAQQLVHSLQDALSERASREAATSERANRAEEALTDLKKAYREVRMQLARAVSASEKASSDLRAAEAARRTAAGSKPNAAVQTEWVSMILPLPAPRSPDSRSPAR